MTGVPKCETYHGFFPAKYVAEYLKSYVSTRFYAGTSLSSRISFNSRVSRLVKYADTWTVFVKKAEGDHETETTCSTSKIVDATGLTSTPNIPGIPGIGIFEGQIFHHKDFGKYQDTILRDSKPRRIAVIGGAKSAADVAYACAKAGNEVRWIIRRSGAGPAAFVAAKGSWPYKNSNESFYTRFTSHFLASWFFDESGTWLGRLLYGTTLGQGLLKAAWRGINRKAHKLADYDRVDGRENGFHNLKPDTEIFWQNDSTGICQRDDFFDTIATKVKVYREDIKSITPKMLELADGSSIEVEDIIFATGWKTSHPEIHLGEEGMDGRLSLGLSVPASDYQTSSPDGHWSQKEAEAEKNVLTRFAILNDRPHYYQNPSTTSRAPLRLFKGVLPVTDRSIAFVGQLLCGNNFRIAEVQALFAVAALDGTLSLPATEEMETIVARTLAWSRLRYLAKGQYGSWIYWDMVPYTDDLLADLGLHSHRHSTWWKDLFAPCFASDLAGLIDEYRAKYQLATRSVSMKQT